MSDKIIGRPFQPGQSGNPGGRPKRGWNWSALFEEAAEEQLTTKDGKITDKAKKFIAKKIVRMAVDGDIAAIKEIVNRMDGMPQQKLTVYPGDVNDLLDTIEQSDYGQLGQEAEKQMVALDAPVQNQEQAGPTGDIQTELSPALALIPAGITPVQPGGEG